ncbi:MAG: ATP-binding protein [Bryobacteraceae bacterium]
MCPAGSFVEGDRLQLERMVSDLVSNAMKYTPAGGSHPRFGVPPGGQGGVAGAGHRSRHPAEHLPHIFDRFYRVPDGESNPAKGLGLGLSFVAWIVKAHDAMIDVASTVGEGTRFRIRFPEAMAPLPRATRPVSARIEA